MFRRIILFILFSAIILGFISYYLVSSQNSSVENNVEYVVKPKNIHILFSHDFLQVLEGNRSIVEELARYYNKIEISWVLFEVIDVYVPSFDARETIPGDCEVVGLLSPGMFLGSGL